MSHHSKEIMRLALFIDELPDANEELFLQHHFDLTTFTCFRKLPIELRVKIWRDTFPRGRLISLQPPTVNPALRSWRRTDAYARAKPPIALFIDSESREEAKKHYIVLSWHNYFHIRPGIPFCFSPTRDKGYIDSSDLLYSHITYPRLGSTPESRLWMRSLQDQFPEQFARIRTLQIFDWIWGDDIRNSIEKVLANGSQVGLKAKFSVMEPLLLLPNLSNIKFVVDERPRQDRMTFGRKEEMRIFIGPFLEIHKETWNGVVPTFDLERWTPMKD